MGSFNPRSQVRERPICLTTSVLVPVFQFALSCEEGPRYLEAIFFYDQFQSTLPRGERPALPEDQIGAIGISIRAPAGGATRERYL